MTNRIKILFLAANPTPGPRLQLDEEVRAISAAIQNGRERDRLDFRPELAVRTSDLQRVILHHEPQVLHFAGHGSESPGLVMGDEDGSEVDVSGKAVAAVVRAAAPSIRLVVLNACSSLRVARLFQNAVDYTIGMDRPISDAAAIRFSAAFYGALASGRSVENAFEWGIAGLVRGTGQEGTPRLRKRRGLHASGVLIPPLAPEPAPAPDPQRHAPPAAAPNSGTAIHANNVGAVNTVHGDNAILYQTRER